MKYLVSFEVECTRPPESVEKELAYQVTEMMELLTDECPIDSFTPIPLNLAVHIHKQCKADWPEINAVFEERK